VRVGWDPSTSRNIGTIAPSERANSTPTRDTGGHGFARDTHGRRKTPKNDEKRVQNMGLPRLENAHVGRRFAFGQKRSFPNLLKSLTFEMKILQHFRRGNGFILWGGVGGCQIHAIH
jgi:hypothetical protein